MKTKQQEEREVTNGFNPLIKNRRSPWMTAATTCSGLSEALKLRKFGGDFNAMLVWWRQHKESEHLALAKANGTSASPLAQITP